MPKKKTNEEFVAELKEKRGSDYAPLEDYKGNQTKIKIKHNVCGNTLEITPKNLLVNGVTCAYCSGNAKLSYDDMKKFIEVESNSGCKLLSTTIKNTQSKVRILCECGNEFITKFSEFKSSGKRQCNDCGNKNKGSSVKHSYDYVKSVIESKGIKLLSEEYVNCTRKLKLMCENGHIYNQTFNDFINEHKCMQCQIENGKVFPKKTYDEVKRYIEDEGYILTSDKYINIKSKLYLICPNGHDIKMSYSEFHNLNNRCGKCYLESIYENAKSDIFVWLRLKIGTWRADSIKNSNYRCVITGDKFDDVHHLYSFNLIVKETIKTLNIDILESISMYTEEERELLKNKCIELHYKYGLGVCLRKDIHKLFHHEYGVRNNTPKQFEEFKVRYNNGEFNNLLNYL